MHSLMAQKGNQDALVREEIDPREAQARAEKAFNAKPSGWPAP